MYIFLKALNKDALQSASPKMFQIFRFPSMTYFYSTGLYLFVFITLRHGTLTLSLSRQCLCQAAKLIIEAGPWTGDQPNQEVQITRVGTMEVSGTLSDLGSLSSSQWSQRRRPGLIKQPAMDHRDLRDHPTLGSVTACHSVIALKIHFRAN